MSAVVRPCPKGHTEPRNAWRQCRVCARERAAASTKKRKGERAITKAPPAAPRMVPRTGCTHASGTTDVATVAGVRTFEDARLWPRSDGVLVVILKSNRATFAAGVWLFAQDTCAACARVHELRPTVAA